MNSDGGSPHVLFKKGDFNLPEIVLDRNGDVVLDLCRFCWRGEQELLDVPMCDTVAAAEHELESRVRKAGATIRFAIPEPMGGEVTPKEQWHGKPAAPAQPWVTPVGDVSFTKLSAIQDITAEFVKMLGPETIISRFGKPLPPPTRWQRFRERIRRWVRVRRERLGEIIAGRDFNDEY